MNVLWTVKEVVEATGGKAQGAWEASNVTIDSRNIKPGALFVALPGERFDGHEFVQEALSKGAAAALVNRIPEGVSENAPLIMVKDTYEALVKLGAYARARSKGKVVGITGSVGKTGAKEALRIALAASGSTHATEGNYNNHIGVPLSLANFPADAAFGIFEMGMNHAGELRQLAQWVKPHVAVITNVEAAHLEFFKSVEDIADAKAEIFEGVIASGAAVLNKDNKQFDRLKQAAEKCGIKKIISFGTGEKATCRLHQYKTTGQGCEVVATINGTALTYRLGAVGKHWGLISVAVLAAADAAGADLANAAAALAEFREPKGRGRLQLVSVGGKEVTLIDDSYNASPASMAAAFEKLREVKESRATPARMLAVLGDMLELGGNGTQIHIGLVPSLVNNQIDLVFGAGHFMKSLYEALPEAMRGAYSPTARELAPAVVNELKQNDIVLVKGSHGSKMSDVVDAIERAGKENGIGD